MSVSICRSFQRLFGHLIVPLEASCRCLKHSSPELNEIGRLDEVRDWTNRYEPGQLFIHKKLSCRGVVLYSWTANVFNRDSVTKKNENLSSADSNQNASESHKKAQTHPYYQVLIDSRDSDYMSLPLDSTVVITDHGNQKQYMAAIKGLDYVAHADIMPYTTTETTTPIDNHLFDGFLMPNPDNSSTFIPRETFPAWQQEYYSQLQLTCVYTETTNNIRVTVIPFYLGSMRKEKNSYLWRYSIRLENLDEQAVEVVSKSIQVFSTSGLLDSIVERLPMKSQRDGKEMGVVLSRKSPVYQFNRLHNLQAPSGHVWGHFTMVREDNTTMYCTIPAFALEVNHDDKTGPEPNFDLIG